MMLSRCLHTLLVFCSLILSFQHVPKPLTGFFLFFFFFFLLLVIATPTTSARFHFPTRIPLSTFHSYQLARLILFIFEGFFKHPFFLNLPFPFLTLLLHESASTQPSINIIKASLCIGKDQHHNGQQNETVSFWYFIFRQHPP